MCRLYHLDLHHLLPEQLLAFQLIFGIKMSIEILVVSGTVFRILKFLDISHEPELASVTVTVNVIIVIFANIFTC